MRVWKKIHRMKNVPAGRETFIPQVDQDSCTNGSNDNGMKILWILLVVSVIRLGSCGYPEYGPGQIGATRSNVQVIKPSRQDQSTHKIQSNVKKTQSTQALGLHSTGSRDLGFDIDGTGSLLFTIEDSFDGDVPIKTLTPKSGYTLTQVSYLGAPIWKAEDGQHCISALLYYDGTTPVLARVRFSKPNGRNGARYYMKDGKWKWIRKDDFDYFLAKMKINASLLRTMYIRLDISSLDDSLFDIQDSFDGKVPLKIITPKEDYKLVQVYEFNMPIWKGERKEYAEIVLLYYDGGCPVLAILRFVAANGERKSRCYGKNGRGWKWIKREDHKKLLKNLKKRAPNPDFGPQTVEDIVLDINSVDNASVAVEEASEEDVPVNILTPTSGYRFTEVVDGEGQLWIGEDGEHAKKVLVYYDEDSPALVTVRFIKYNGKRISRRYMKQYNGEWIWITKKDFDEELREIKGEIIEEVESESEGLDLQDFLEDEQGDQGYKYTTPPSTSTQPTTQKTTQKVPQEPKQPPKPSIDLTSKVDSTLFDVKEWRYSGITLLTCVAKAGETPTNFVYDNRAIWPGKSNKHCSSATIYFKGDKPHLVTLTTKDKKDKETTTYLHQTGIKWEDKKKDFDEKLKELKVASSSFDLNYPDNSLCKFFEVNINGVPAKVYAVNPGVDITKLLYNNYVLFVPRGKKCLFWAIFLEDEEPKIQMFLLKESTTVFREFRELKKNGWELTFKDNDIVIAALKTHTDALTKFTLDISSDTAPDGCDVTKDNEDGLTSTIYISKPNHTIEKGMDGKTPIFQLNEAYTCYLVEVYSKGGSKIMRIHGESGYNISLVYYTKENGAWKTINQDAFDSKFKELLNAPTT